MDAFLYNAALYCDDCGRDIRRELKARGPVDRLGGSDSWPDGPHGDGGGEADSPCHCDACGAFLENPLTTDGVDYVVNALWDAREDGGGNSDALDQWSEFYGIRLPESDDLLYVYDWESGEVLKAIPPSNLPTALVRSLWDAARGRWKVQVPVAIDGGPFCLPGRLVCLDDC